MRQTLFYIPDEIAGISVLGFGWALAVWTLLSGVMLARALRRRGWTSETKGLLQFQAIVAVAIALLLPMFEVKDLGLPIRGYGMMMLAGVIAGVLTAAYRAGQAGLDPERIYALVIWFIVAGIGGARLFFVIQYFDTFMQDSWTATLVEIVRFTEGGLVVYGALLGAAAAFVLFAHRYRIPPLRLADVIAPSLFLGLALGRIGCLLNGCCYGGFCEDGPWGITFPKYSAPERETLSPPYHAHLMSGALHGLRLASDPQGRVIVRGVQPQSPAARTGLEAGTVITAINGHRVSNLAEAHSRLLRSGTDMVLIDARQRAYRWSIGALPARSLPVHPAQLYSALNALLIFAVGWLYFPLRRCDGEVFGVVMLLYPATRFLLEAIRSDELGRFGTSLTISQWLSLAIFVAMGAYWVWLLLRDPGRESAEGALTRRSN